MLPIITQVSGKDEPMSPWFFILSLIGLVVLAAALRGCH